MSEEMKNVNIEDTQETEAVAKKDETKAEKFIRLLFMKIMDSTHGCNLHNFASFC